jgi:hypothetical protein
MWGTSCGHDLTFHVDCWIEVVKQWETGILYPRWAAFANYLSGEPRFIFYPPLSWMVGGLLGLMLPWTAVPGALSFLVCVASGVSMFLFAREWLDDRAAVLVGVIYAVNPYQLMVIYERSAFGELVASIWIPGMLLFALRSRGGFARNSLLLALQVALIWLTNAPAAVIASYLLAFVVILRALLLRSVEPIFRAALATVLGLGLAAFYVLPAAYEQRWVEISSSLSFWLRPQDNFLFSRVGDTDHDVALRSISVLCLMEFGALALFAWLAKPLRDRNPGLYKILLGISVACILLMFPISNVLWQHLPKLSFLQFPWRWLLVFNIVLATFAGASFARAPRFAWSLLILVPALVAVCYLRFHQVCDPEDRVPGILETFDSGSGYMGVYEYAPRGAHYQNIHPYTPRIAIQTDKRDQQIVESALIRSCCQLCDAEQYRFTITSNLPTHSVARLLNYPAWKIEVDGMPYQPEVDRETGRMVIELPAGHHQVSMNFSQTPDRKWGGVISLISVIVALGLWLVSRTHGQT